MKSLLDTLPLFVRSDIALPLVEGNPEHPKGFLTDFSAEMSRVPPSLTVLLPPDSRHSQTIYIPQGTLTLSPRDEPASLEGESAQLSSMRDHAPFLSLPGSLYQLAPGKVGIMHHYQWVWHGQTPLLLTIRLLNKFQ